MITLMSAASAAHDARGEASWLPMMMLMPATLRLKSISAAQTPTSLAGMLFQVDGP